MDISQALWEEQIERMTNNFTERTKPKERCPTCGEPVNSIFDHVDRDDQCNEIEEPTTK